MKWISFEYLAIIFWILFQDVINSGQTNGVSIIENHGKTSRTADNLKPCLIPSAQSTVYKILKSGKQDESLSQNPAVTGNGTVVYLECPGPEIKRESTSWFGEHYMVCYDGQWYPPGNKCIKLCPAISLPNSVIECSLHDKPVSCEKNILPHTVAKKSCKSGHSDSSIFKSVECLETGEWSLPALVDCYIKCGNIDRDYQSDGNELNDALVESPWIAGLYKKVNGSEHAFKFICVATLVSTDTVITAARCVVENGVTIDKAFLRVGFSKNYLEWNDERDIHSQKFEVSIVTDFSLHKNVSKDFVNTLKLLEEVSFLILKGRSVVNSFLRPICADANAVNTKIPQLNGKVTGWNEHGERVTYDTVFYTNGECRNMISKMRKRNENFEKEIMKFGRFCTDRTFPKTFYGTGAVFQNKRSYSSIGVLIKMDQSISIFIGSRTKEATTAITQFYFYMIHKNRQ